MTPQEQLRLLRSPSKSLPRFGEVQDQETSAFVRYDPLRLTHSLQTEVLEYLDAPPRIESGHTSWLTILTARQMGKSLVVEYGLYPKTAYSPGWDHTCIADTQARADYLHRRVHSMHMRWPEEIRSPTRSTNERRQLTFDNDVGGRMRVLSAESGAAGIGQSPDSFHASECAFWEDFQGTMSLIYPSIINRANSIAVFECTPWRAGDDWHEHVISAKKGRGRNKYLFKPFWDGVLNTRKWDSTWSLDKEEEALLEKFGPLGLTLQNLAFRRFTLDTDPNIRRHPELFATFYPFDDISCWVVNATSAIPAHALDKHRRHDLIRTNNVYHEAFKPVPGSKYVIGVDPCGHAARDHAAFQVLEVTSDTWVQSAWYADHSDPVTFARKLMNVGMQYNKARIVVESNGVGQAVIALLREWGYPNLHYHKGQPGVPTSGQSLEDMTSRLIDALLDTLELHDSSTVDQLMTYRHDKKVEESPNTEIVRGESSKRRRERHHWDSVSALMLAIVGARTIHVNKHHYPQKPAGDNPIHSGLYRADIREKEHKEIERRRKALAFRRKTWYR